MNEENRIRLILLDGEALFRSSLARLLAFEAGFEVVAECGDTTKALNALHDSTVDVVLLDFEHATGSGDHGFIAEARRQGYRGRFLIVAGNADAQNAALAIRLGASGIFLKSEAPDRLVQALNLVNHGAVWFDQRVIQALADQSVAGLLQPEAPASALPLSERERKVLLGILGGLTNRKIGANLGLSEAAVKASVQHLFHKTGVRTRGQLVRAALEGSLGKIHSSSRQLPRPVEASTSNDGDFHPIV